MLHELVFFNHYLFLHFIILHRVIKDDVFYLRRHFNSFRGNHENKRIYKNNVNNTLKLY